MYGQVWRYDNPHRSWTMLNVAAVTSAQICIPVFIAADTTPMFTLAGVARLLISSTGFALPMLIAAVRDSAIVRVVSVEILILLEFTFLAHTPTIEGTSMLFIPSVLRFPVNCTTPLQEMLSLLMSILQLHCVWMVFFNALRKTPFTVSIFFPCMCGKSLQQ